MEENADHSEFVSCQFRFPSDLSVSFPPVQMSYRSRVFNPMHPLFPKVSELPRPSLGPRLRSIGQKVRRIASRLNGADEGIRTSAIEMQLRRSRITIEYKDWREELLRFDLLIDEAVGGGY